MKELEIQREILKQAVKQIEVRIKEIQQEIKDSYTQDDVTYKQGAESEMISLKIQFEKWSKKLKHQIDENNKN